MDSESKLKRELKKLFTKQKLAVLATHKNGQPYSSLVAFAVTDDLKHLIFATSRSTRKYEHFSSDGRVALLIDNRSNKVADFHSAIAVTAVGTAMEPDENNRQELAQRYLAKHPHLKDFVHSPTCALCEIRVQTFIVVTRFQKVVEVHISQ